MKIFFICTTNEFIEFYEKENVIVGFNKYSDEGEYNNYKQQQHVQQIKPIMTLFTAHNRVKHFSLHPRNGLCLVFLKQKY